MSKGEYIRKLISGYVPKESPPYTYYQMIQELNAIGNNINQLAYIANLTGDVEAAKLKEILYVLFEKIEEIKTAVERPEKILKGNNGNS